MNGLMNQSVSVKEYKFDKPPMHKILTFIKALEVVLTIFFHTFDLICVYDIKLTNIGKNEKFNLAISGKNTNLYELNEHLAFARRKGFIFYQSNELTMNFYSNLSNINKHYCLKLQIPIRHRHFFKNNISKSRLR